MQEISHEGCNFKRSVLVPRVPSRHLMSSIRTIAQFAAAVATLLLANCANQKPGAQTTKDGKFVNPYPAGTYDHFKAEPTYLKTKAVWSNQELLSRTNAGNSSIVISLEKQRGFLMNGGEVVIDYPVSSGIYDAAGEVVNSDADSTLDPIPEGGRFEGAPMRYWMRLTNDGIGHHIGPLPSSRRPASHACIRGPSATIPVVFSKVKLGTRVVVE